MPLPALNICYLNESLVNAKEIEKVSKKYEIRIKCGEQISIHAPITQSYGTYQNLDHHFNQNRGSKTANQSTENFNTVPSVYISSTKGVSGSD